MNILIRKKFWSKKIQSLTQAEHFLLDLDLDIFQNQNKVHTTKQINLYLDI